MPTARTVHKSRTVGNKRKRCKVVGGKVYHLAKWRSAGGIRSIKLGNDPLCEMCRKKDFIVAATHVDHIDGDSSNNDFENLQSLCKPCHSRKTVEHDGGFGRKVKRLVR